MSMSCTPLSLGVCMVVGPHFFLLPHIETDYEVHRTYYPAVRALAGQRKMEGLTERPPVVLTVCWCFAWVRISHGRGLAHLLRIRDVPGSHLGRKTGYPVFMAFLSLQNARIVP
jgi:hypothetical protein